jgi:hypothetical protein
MPQAGEQPVLATESVHVTPLLPGSPDTLADNVTGAPPASTKRNVLLTETTIPVVAVEEDPHPEFGKLTKIANNGSNKHRVAQRINHSPGFVGSSTAGVAQGNRRTIGHPCECGDTVLQMFRDSMLAGRYGALRLQFGSRPNDKGNEFSGIVAPPWVLSFALIPFRGGCRNDH